MPTLDQASLGTANNSAVTTLNLTTTNPVAAGGLIVFAAGRFNVTTTVTLAASGGGLTWTATPTAGVTNSSYRVYLFWAFAPAGLPAASTLTITASSASDITAAAVSYLGVDTVGTAVASGTGTGAATAWGAGAVAGSAGDLYVGVAAGDAGAARTSTPTGPAVERIDFFGATSGGSLTIADKLAGSASDLVAGAWSANISHGSIGVAFKAAAGGGAVVAPTVSDPAVFFDEHGPGDFGPNQFVDPTVIETGAPGATLLSDSDSGTATETGSVSATVPGSDSSTSSEAGTVSATASSSDSGAGTDTGTVSATASGSDSAAATDTGVSSVTGSGSDTGTGSEGGTASVTASGSDSATATEGQNLDTGATPITGSDSAATTETGTVSVTASGSDSGSASEGQTLDTGTPPVTPPTGPTGGAGMVDETSIYGDFRALTGADRATLAMEFGAVVDLTPEPPVPQLPRITLRRTRKVTGKDALIAADAGVLVAAMVGADHGRLTESAVVEVFDPEGEAELEAHILGRFGLSGP